MKPIKMFGLAVMAALMAMAFVGASSAMATGSTALCTHDETPCATGNLVSHVHEVSVGTPELLSSPTITCAVLFLGDTKNAKKETVKLANPLRLEGTFSYSSCNNSCTVTEENSPAEITVLRTAAELATVVGEGLVHVNCFFGFINCRYNGLNLEGHALGPLTATNANGEIVIEEKETHIESGGCPAEAFLDLTTTPLTAPVYISQ